MSGPLLDADFNSIEREDVQPDNSYLTVEVVANGFIIRCAGQTAVVEEDEHREDAGARATLRLLYTILDMLDLRGSEYDAYRCRVRIVTPEGKDVTDRA